MKPILLCCLLALLSCQLPAADKLKPAKFPLRVSANGRHLEDQRGQPFLLHGDTGWLLFYRLSEKEAGYYLENRAEMGFNTVLVQLLAYEERLMSSEGLPPLLNPTDLSTPNEAFFKHVDRVVRIAQQQRLLLGIAPAWLGCCQGGWKDILKANGPDKCREFGRWVGRRYAKAANIFWIHSGDNDAAEHRALVKALAEGLKEAAPNHLHTAHVGSPQSASSLFAGEPWLDINSTYTYSPHITSVGRPQFHVYAAALADYQRQPAKPFFLIESTYENERNAKPQWIRRQAWWAMTSGAMGQVFGNKPLYNFNAGWGAALIDAGSQQMTQLRLFFDRIAWQTLVPDAAHEFIVAGYGTFDGAAGKDEKHRTGFDYVTATAAPDGSLLVAYLPEGGSPVVNMAKLKQGLQVQWFDPVGGQYAPAFGQPLESGRIRYDSPGLNRGHDRDFVLLFTPVR